MRCGIIDIGSNTIRGVGYRVETNKAVKIEDKLVKSHLLHETVDNCLSEEGINRLIAVISKLKYVLRNEGCQSIDCFATSSMRGLRNIKEITDAIFTATATEISVLSENEEIEYDFYAMRANVPEHSAIGLDLGGGSCQLIQFDLNSKLFSNSFEIGSNRIMRRFVSGLLPTAEERKKIDFFVKNEMVGVSNLFGSRYLYAMGGTAKSALKLYNKLSNTTQSGNFLGLDKLELLSRLPDSDDPQKMYNKISEIVKSRAGTIIPGVTVLKTICDVLDVDGVYVLSCSVRDGYLIHKIRNNK